MSSWNRSRRGGLRDLGECWYLCLSCPEGTRFQPGGGEGLKKHLTLVHGRDDWPITETVDSDGFVLDADGARRQDNGEPVQPADGIDGLLTTRATVSRLSRFREGR